MGKTLKKLEIEELAEQPEGSAVRVAGTVHNVRDMGDFSFVILRKKDGLVQAVFSKAEAPGADASMFREECCVELCAIVHKEPRAPGGFELRITGGNLLSSPAEPMPICINKHKVTASLEANLAVRPLALRNPRERAVFKLQESLVRGFREYLQSIGFTEIHTPKIVAAGAEGGSNLFRIDYFGKKAFLAQSPQFYKQMMVGVFERVFEVGPVFRAEKHSTARHLNEYTGLDLEMGFIDSFEDVMQVENDLLRYTMDLIRGQYAKYAKVLGVKIPEVGEIPRVRFDEAKQLISEKYNHVIRNPFDMEPEEEQLVGRYFLEEKGSDFVFVTHYPSKKRPFYAMDDPADPRYTLSFDLLFRGTEITTGGQRIHDYEEQTAKMRMRKMDPADFESYLMIHKHGMPPHGGLGIGLERLLTRLLDEKNVRVASLFPRDLHRLEP